MLKVIEMFGGIGAFRKALINLKVPFEVVDYIEIDKKACEAYNLLYEPKEITKDITNYSFNNIDILWHSSPCQDFSSANTYGNASKMTKSILYQEVLRILQEGLKPKVIIWENVETLLSKNNSIYKEQYCCILNKLGYVNKTIISNGLEGGAPQSRKRVFIISILKKYNINFDNFKIKTNSLKPLRDFILPYHPQLSSYIEEAPSALKAIKQNKDFIIDEEVLKNDNSIVRALLTKQKRWNVNMIKLKNNEYRNLTPLEYARLMGFDDEDYFKIKKLGDTTCYRLFENSVIVSVVEVLLKALFKLIDFEKIHLIEQKERLQYINQLMDDLNQHTLFNLLN